MHKLNIGIWRFYLLSLCLLTGASVTAQARSEGNSTSTTQAGKQFRFEVVSIRPHKPGSAPISTWITPDGYGITARISVLIMTAYNPEDWSYWQYSKIQNAPAWVTHDKYDIQARVAEKDMAAWKRVQGKNSELLRSALRAVLSERCGLKLHSSRIEIPYLNLVVDKHGAKLKENVPGTFHRVENKTAVLGDGFFVLESGQWRFSGVSMAELAIKLTSLSQFYPVQDKTGLTGRYDFTLPWKDYSRYPQSEITNPIDRLPIAGIGLRLKQGKGPAFIFDIDQINKPDAN